MVGFLINAEFVFCVLLKAKLWCRRVARAHAEKPAIRVDRHRYLRHLTGSFYGFQLRPVKIGHIQACGVFDPIIDSGLGGEPHHGIDSVPRQSQAWWRNVTFSTNEGLRQERERSIRQELMTARVFFIDVIQSCTQ